LWIDWIATMDGAMAKYDVLIRGRTVAMMGEVEEGGKILPSLHKGEELDEAFAEYLHEAVVKMTKDLVGIIGGELVIAFSTQDPGSR